MTIYGLEFKGGKKLAYSQGFYANRSPEKLKLVDCKKLAEM